MKLSTVCLGHPVILFNHVITIKALGGLPIEENYLFILEDITVKEKYRKTIFITIFRDHRPGNILCAINGYRNSSFSIIKMNRF